jgi:hypothetical protein
MEAVAQLDGQGVAEDPQHQVDIEVRAAGSQPDLKIDQIIGGDSGNRGGALRLCLLEGFGVAGIADEDFHALEVADLFGKRLIVIEVNGGDLGVRREVIEALDEAIASLAQAADDNAVQ